MKSVWGAHVRCPKKLNVRSNAYANSLELAYAVNDHPRQWSGTYDMYIKG